MAKPQLHNMAEFNFKELFENAFGYQPNTEAVPQISAKGDRVEYSQIGTPYYGQLDGIEFFQPIYIDDMLIPFGVMSQTWKKTVVRTPMVERGGSVKELISIDDYMFNIKGIIISADNSFPEDKYRQIVELWKKDSSVTMRSVLSDYVLNGRTKVAGDDPLGHRVIISEIKWPAIPGVENARAFDMEVEADLIFDLEL